MFPTYLTRLELTNNFPVPKSRPGLRKWIRARGFPKPIYPSPNCPMWEPTAVVNWFENCPRNHQDAKAATRGEGV